MHEPEQDEELDVLDFSNASRRAPANEIFLPNTNAFCAALEQRYITHHSEIVSKDGFIRTPMNCLREISKEWRMNIHSECNEIQDIGYKLYVVEVYVGHMIGYGECTRRKMASYMAAADILEQVRNKNDWIVIPEYGLPPGCRISPSIFREVATACKIIGATAPVYYQEDDPKLQIDPSIPPPRYSFKCQVGQLTQHGYSDSLYLAKRWAAYKMFEALTGCRLKLDRVCSGPICKETLKHFNVVNGMTSLKLGAMNHSFSAGALPDFPEVEDDDYTVLDFDEELDQVEASNQTMPNHPEEMSEEFSTAVKNIKDRFAGLNIN